MLECGALIVFSRRVAFLVTFSHEILTKAISVIVAGMVFEDIAHPNARCLPYESPYENVVKQIFC